MSFHDIMASRRRQNIGNRRRKRTQRRSKRRSQHAGGPFWDSITQGIGKLPSTLKDSFMSLKQNITGKLEGNNEAKPAGSVTVRTQAEKGPMQEIVHRDETRGGGKIAKRPHTRRRTQRKSRRRTRRSSRRSRRSRRRL